MRQHVLRALSYGPKAIERLLRVFPADRLDDKLDVDRFTAREVIAHLADYEQVHLDRIRYENLHPGARLPQESAETRASEHHYSEKDAFHEAEVFESRRMTTLEFLEGLAPEDWNKPMAFVGGGETTIMEYVVSMVAHDLYHLEQLTQYLATEVATIA